MHEFGAERTPDHLLEPMEVRHARVIETGEFWDEYKSEMHEIFNVLGLSEAWSENPEDLIPMLREQWIGTEHGKTRHNPFTDQQIEAGLKVIDRIGLTRELLPPPGHHRQAVIPGGFIHNIDTRFKLAEAWLAEGATVDELVILAGQRPLDPEREGSPEEVLAGRVRYGWPYDPGDYPELRQKLLGEPFFSETQVALAALGGYFGKFDAIRPVIQLHDVTGLSRAAIEASGSLPKQFDDIPLPIIKSLTLNLSVGNNGAKRQQKTIITIGAAVERKGKARPTTDSTVREYLEWCAPSTGTKEDPAEIAVFSSVPYGLRMHEEIQRILNQTGRHDLRMIRAIAPPPSVSPSDLLDLSLGELGRLVNRSPSVMERLQAKEVAQRDMAA